MYSFQDRNGEWLSLRPEGTAGCVRAVIENNLLVSAPLRLFYFGEMFRYERPQKGRQRQFTQFGFELFGVRQVYAEFEIICMMEEIWRALGLDHLSLEINSLGSDEDRIQYTQELKNYFSKYSKEFDNSTKETFERNPLRLLDSKKFSYKGIEKRSSQNIGISFRRFAAKNQMLGGNSCIKWYNNKNQSPFSARLRLLLRHSI